MARKQHHISATVRTWSLWALLLAAPCLYAQDPVYISIEVFNETKDGICSGAMSAVTCWLTDSDLNITRARTMQQAYSDMRVGAIRFPYGHLADNYLWHTPGTYDQAGTGLTPRPADPTIAPGGSWASWSLEVDGTFRNDLDFDEFMSMCQALNVKPLIVVNAQSHLYADSIVTYEQLKTNAVEWVKYAKSNGYEVAYWQIGNEVDHHQDILPQADYISLYSDFAAAMKAEDSTIKVGPGILGNTSYYNDILAGDAGLVDFLSAHQYLWGAAASLSSYGDYRDFSGPVTVLSNISKATTANTTAKLPILVTECNAYGLTNLPSAMQNVYAMIWFEHALSIVDNPNIENLFFWGSHDPWDGDPVNESATTYTLLDGDNNLTPRGKMHKALNDFLPDDLVSTVCSSNVVQSWSGMTTSKDELVVFMVNRDTTSKSVTLDTGAFSISNVTASWQYDGQSTTNGDHTIGEVTGTVFSGNTATCSVPAFSVSAVRFSGSTDFGQEPFEADIEREYYIAHPVSGLRLAATGEDNSPYLASGTTTGAYVEWKFVPKGGPWHIDLAAGGSTPRLRANGSGVPNMTATTSVGSWVQFNVEKAATPDTFYITVTATNLIGNERLQVDGANTLKLVDKSVTNTSVEFTITEVPQVTTNHAVPHLWLSTVMGVTGDYEAAVTNDADNDGFATWEEYWSGTDPTNSGSFLQIDDISLTVSNLILSWQHAQVDTNIPPVFVQSCTDLTAGTWTSVGTNPPVNGTNTWSIVPVAGQACYRLCVTNVP